jgi:AraC-like DNA-binding protein
MTLCEINSVGAETRERLVARQRCPELGDYGIILCGLSAARAGFTFQRMAPAMRQVLACLAGGGEVLVDGDWRPCGPGQTYLTPARQPHAYRATGTWDLAWVMYAADPPAGCAPEITAPTLVATPADGLARAIDGLHREVLGHDEPAARAAWARLLQLETRRLVAGAPHDDRLDRLWAAVSANLAGDWTLATMAARGCVGGEHLRRLCRRRYGQSPGRRLRELRLERAAALLTTTALTVATIARLVGYTDAFAFSTAFKRAHGRSPAAWRQEEIGAGNDDR